MCHSTSTHRKPNKITSSSNFSFSSIYYQEATFETNTRLWSHSKLSLKKKMVNRHCHSRKIETGIFPERKKMSFEFPFPILFIWLHFPSSLQIQRKPNQMLSMHVNDMNDKFKCKFCVLNFSKMKTKQKASTQKKVDYYWAFTCTTMSFVNQTKHYTENNSESEWIQTASTAKKTKKGEKKEQQHSNWIHLFGKIVAWSFFRCLWFHLSPFCVFECVVVTLKETENDRKKRITEEFK